MNLRPGCFHSAAGPVLFFSDDALPFTCLFTSVARPIEPIAADKTFIDCHYIVDEHGEGVPALKIHPTQLVAHGAIRGYLCFYDAAGNVIHTWHLGMFSKAFTISQYNNTDAYGRLFSLPIGAEFNRRIQYETEQTSGLRAGKN